MTARILSRFELSQCAFGARRSPGDGELRLGPDDFLVDCMYGRFYQVKLTLPQHNPINWMLVDLESRLGQDLERQIAFLRRGESSPGPGTSFARFDLGHFELDHPEFAVMKAAWEASTGRCLDEPVWKVQNDWEQTTAFIPQSSLERVVLEAIAKSHASASR